MTQVVEVEDLLDAIHRALLCADLAALRHLTPALETAIAGLQAVAAPPGTPARRDLERLRRKAGRNAACALAAGRGVRAAGRRLAEIRQAAAGLVTYDRAGHRRESPETPGQTRRF